MKSHSFFGGGELRLIADTSGCQDFQTHTSLLHAFTSSQGKICVKWGLQCELLWCLTLELSSCRPSSSPCAIQLAWVLTAREQDQRQPWHARNKNTAHFSAWLWCVLSKACSPPLLPGPKATIVFVVVIDIVFHPYNTKQSDHDSDANNVEVEREF